MKVLRTALASLALTAGLLATCSAQSFPLKSGHWDATVKSQGQTVDLPQCLNDETWKHALNTDKACTVSQFSTGLLGGSYHLTCILGKTATMDGDVKLSFDGKEHMTAASTLHLTMSGKLTTMESTADYHWKSSTCTGDEVNLLAEKRAKERQH